MASYHLTVNVGSKGKGASHALYISREGKYSGHSRYEDLEATQAGNMPKWAEHSPSLFWQASDEFERSNGSTYREIEVALPRELTPEQRRELVEEFVMQEIGDRHAYQWAIHTPKAALEKGEQPHAHIMYSERTRDGIERDPSQYFKRYNARQPELGGAKKANTAKTAAERQAELVARRERWATRQNAHLARHGHAARVDHRSLKDQGIERPPELHLGGRGVRSLSAAEVTAVLERRVAEGQLERANTAVASTIIDLSGDLRAAKAARLRQGLEREAQRFDRTYPFKSGPALGVDGEKLPEGARSASRRTYGVPIPFSRLGQMPSMPLDGAAKDVPAVEDKTPAPIPETPAIAAAEPASQASPPEKPPADLSAAEKDWVAQQLAQLDGPDGLPDLDAEWDEIERTPTLPPPRLPER